MKQLQQLLPGGVSTDQQKIGQVKHNKVEIFQLRCSIEGRHSERDQVTYRTKLEGSRKVEQGLAKNKS